MGEKYRVTKKVKPNFKYWLGRDNLWQGLIDNAQLFTNEEANNLIPLVIHNDPYSIYKIEEV